MVAPMTAHGASRAIRPGNRPRVLIVEDYWLVAIQAQLMFEDHQCEVVGTVGTLEEGCSLARESDLDGARRQPG